MASIDSLKASDGSGNASVATVQNARSPLATTIQVDTVQGINTNFYGTMGTPHTFTDPITGETITVISEDTAVDFKGHVDGSNLEIDDIAPGYVDNGSEVGDIVIIRPTTQWGDEVAEVLEVSHNDDGTIKNDAITTKDQFVDALDPVQRLTETIFDFVASGLVWSGDSYGSTRAASMTAGVVYINGVRVPISAVTARSFTASKDTYIDVGTDGVLDYTEVANNAASPALAANHIRIGIIVTGASSIANVGSVNQGQLDKVLPIASSVPYTFTDSLGNIIYPRDPQRRLLGYKQIIANQAVGGDVTGLAAPVIVPEGSKIEVDGRAAAGTTVDNSWFFYALYEGATALVSGNTGKVAASNTQIKLGDSVELNPSAGLHTYKVNITNGSSTIFASATNPAFIRVRRG